MRYFNFNFSKGDLNNDRIDDLIISAPVHSKTNLYQNGAVFVLFSSETHTGSMNYIDVETMADLIFYPPVNVLNARFGHSVLVFDLNQDGFDDVVISAPSYNLRNISYEGRVFIYFGGRSNFNDFSIEITCETVINFLFLYYKKNIYLYPSTRSSFKSSNLITLRTSYKT
jgi:glycosylphosphatidylinositol phospholipase D